MKLTTKIYLIAALAASLVIGSLAGSAWSNHKMRQLERDAEAARQTAVESRNAADRLELDAAAYQQKIIYLEDKLSAARETSKKQDEKIKNKTDITRNARADVERARRTRTNDATAAELCQKLAALGHPCG